MAADMDTGPFTKRSLSEAPCFGSFRHSRVDFIINSLIVKKILIFNGIFALCCSLAHKMAA